MFSYLDSRDKTAVMAKKMKYFTKNGERRGIFFFIAQSFVLLLIDFFPLQCKYCSVSWLNVLKQRV